MSQRPKKVLHQVRSALRLEGYARLSHGPLALYEATLDERWFLEARSLADEMIARFKDLLGAGFYDTDGEEALFTRRRSREDGAPFPPGTIWRQTSSPACLL